MLDVRDQGRVTPRFTLPNKRLEMRPGMAANQQARKVAAELFFELFDGYLGARFSARTSKREDIVGRPRQSSGDC